MAARRLAGAHVDLAKAEGGVILAEVKWIAIRAAVALAMLVFIALLVPVGMTLFLGEWLFGSMGWGILHGTLLAIAVAVVMALSALHVSRSYLTGTLVAAIVIGVLVGAALGLDWTNRAYAAVGDSVVPGIDAGIRPLVVGLAVGALVVGLLGLLVGARASGASGAVGGLVGGAILGLPLGALTAISFTLPPGAALGVTAGLVAWPILAALALRGYDWEELKRRFVPQASIDAARETKEFVQSRMPRRKEGDA